MHATLDRLTVTVAAIGPIVTEALAERVVRVDLMPDSSYFMKPLVREPVNTLGAAEAE